MPRTQEELANLAMGYLSRGVIRSLDDQTVEATTLKRNIPLAMDYVIAEYDWPESRVIAKLTEVSLDYKRGWAFAYAVPADLVSLFCLQESTRSTKVYPYERGMSEDVSSDKSYIFTDLSAAYARYGSSRANVTRFNPLVFDLVARRLALYSCMTITKDAKLASKIEADYLKQLNHATTKMANAEPDLVEISAVPEFIQVRSS